MLPGSQGKIKDPFIIGRDVHCGSNVRMCMCGKTFYLYASCLTNFDFHNCQYLFQELLSKASSLAYFNSLNLICD